MLKIRNIRPAGQSVFAEKQDSDKFNKEHMIVLEMVQKPEGVSDDEAILVSADVTASTYVKTVRMDSLTPEKLDANGKVDVAAMLADVKQKWMNKEIKSYYGFDIPISEILPEHDTLLFTFAPDGQNKAQSRHIVGMGKDEKSARENAISQEKARLTRAIAAGIVTALKEGV